MVSFGSLPRAQVCIGGRGRRDEHFGDVHVFDTATNTWMRPSTDSGETLAPRGWHTVDVVELPMEEGAAEAGTRSYVVLYGGSSDYDASVQGCTRYHNDTLAFDAASIANGHATDAAGTATVATATATGAAAPAVAVATEVASTAPTTDSPRSVSTAVPRATTSPGLPSCSASNDSTAPKDASIRIPVKRPLDTSGGEDPADSAARKKPATAGH